MTMRPGRRRPTAQVLLKACSGLVQTTAETIRPGRVQAVRLVEPLVWRACGWCRLEVDVAGPRQRRENRSEGRRLRPLVPVGTRADVQNMLTEVVSAPPSPSERPPRHARWKAPLMYHFLAWGGDDHYLVASHGRLRRTTTWIPLEKVQSVRWVQGPVQRRLGLASVRLDVAGRRVTASVQDRTMAEADDLLRTGVGFPGGPGAVQGGGLRDRHVPPAFRGRDRRERVRLDVDDRGPRRLPGLAQRDPELLDRPGPQHVRARQRVGRRGPRRADPAHRLRVVPGQRALAGLGVGDRDAGPLGQPPQRILRLRIQHPAACDDERPAGAADHAHGA